MWTFREKSNQLKDCNYSQGCLLFASSLFVVIISKMNQSSQDFFLFETRSWDCFVRVSSQGTSILLSFSCIEVIAEYIFDV